MSEIGKPLRKIVVLPHEVPQPQPAVTPIKVPAPVREPEKTE